MKVFNGILFTLFVVLFVGCSVEATDTPEFPPGLASALVDEKIISDLDIFLIPPDKLRAFRDDILRDCSFLIEYLFRPSSTLVADDREYYALAEEYLGNGVWKVQLVNSTGELLGNELRSGPYEWNVYERTNTVGRTSSVHRKFC